MKVDLQLDEPMRQPNGRIIKDTGNLKGAKTQEEAEKMLEEAPPLTVGVFLSTLLGLTNTVEKLTDLRRFFNMAGEVYEATQAKVKAGAETTKPAFEVDGKWLQDALDHLEKERKNMRPEWNNATFLGQVAGFLISAQVELENKAKAAKATSS